MGKEKVLEVGDFVFAKVRGYPPWPARILSIVDPKILLKYEVFFYGTSETAVVQEREVFPYEEFKDRYGKPMKRKYFKEGMDEIQAEIKKKNEVDSKIDTPKEDLPLAKTDVKTTKRLRESVDDEGPETKIKRKASIDVKIKSRGSSVDPEHESKRKKSTTTSEVSDSKEHTSRSGRVIKPKRFLYDAEEKEDFEAKKFKPYGSPVHKENLETKESIEESPKKIRKGKSNPEQPEKSDKNDKKDIPEKNDKVEKPNAVKSLPLAPFGRVLWVRVKSGELVQIKIDHDRPKFKDNKSRRAWEENYTKNIAMLKDKIETGSIVPDEVPLQCMPSPEKLHLMTYAEKHALKKAQWLERKRGQIRMLHLETRMLEINIALRTCLQKDEANLKKAVELLDELIDIPMESLTLKKYPQLVETIKKIQFYIGNAESWKMTGEEHARFKASAGSIRQKASTVFNKFQNLFSVPAGGNFLSVFKESVAEFKSLTKDMTDEKVISLVIDPTSPLFKEVLVIFENDDNFESELMDAMKREVKE